MTWSKEVTLWCDGGGCEEWETFNGGHVGRAVQRARKKGWTSPEWDVHLCPGCGRMAAHPDEEIPYSDPPYNE